MQACAFREASYRFSDSLCILNPAAEKRKTDRQKDRGKKWETEGKKKSVVFFHSPLIPKTFKSAPARKEKSNKDNALPVYPCLHSALQGCAAT